MISAAGSTSLDAADFILNAGAAQPNQFGIFFYGQSTANVPFGDGVRCVGAPVTRLPVVQADVFGSASYQPDFTSAPHNQVTVDSTWNFQFWYRTPSSPSTFNLSDAISVTFCQ